MNRFLVCFSIIGFLVLSLFSCKTDRQPDYYNLPTFTEKGVNVVIEIPAGTNMKYEFDAEAKIFDVEVIDGKKRKVDFLPYPGNYGFIPSTLMDTERGGDGDALDILVIAESLPTGTVVEVQPIATLRLLDRGELDTKLIAVPVDSTLTVINAKNYQDFLINYNAVQYIIQSWFLSYKGLGKMELLGWDNEKAAMAEIKKWAKTQVKAIKE